MYNIGKLTKLKPTKEQSDTIRDYVLQHIEDRERLPTIEDLAVRLQIPSEVVDSWGRKYPRIAILLEQINDLQRDFMQRKPNAGNVFLLKAKHNYTEKKEETITHNYHIDNRPLDIIAGEIVEQLNDGTRPVIEAKDRE